MVEDADMTESKSECNTFSLKPIKELPLKVKETTSTRIEDLDEDTVCGIWIFKPQWLQPLATAKMFLLLYSAIGVIQGSTFTYTIGTLSTVEKRYAFSSKTSAGFLMMDEILAVILGPFIGYFGNKCHRPRLIFWGMCMTVLCSFVSALPYFLYGASEHLMERQTTGNNTMSAVCRSDVANSCIDDDRPPTTVAIVCFYIGFFFKGFGGIAFYSIGASFMDDSAKRKNSILYFATSWSMRLFGPILGFLLSSACLKYYETPSIDPGITSDDPRWIGAWWLGHVILAVLLLIVSLPFLVFPKRLPGQRQRHLLRRKSLRDETFQENILGFLNALKRLLTNPLYMANIAALTLYGYAQLGFFTMLPKYIEHQFHMSASNANLVSGPTTLFAVQISIFVGGVIIWKFKPTPRQIVVGTIISYCILAATFLGIMIPSCKSHFLQTEIDKNEMELYNTCNSNCKCTTSALSPVCGPHGISYFSPCFAGCSGSETIDGNQIHRNCSCTYDDSGEFQFTAAVEKGFCIDDGCSKQLVIYIVSYFFMSILAHFFAVILDIFCIRAVDPEDKAFSIGAFEGFLAVASIPSTIMYGALIDSSCLIWESTCGKTGNCWYYDLDKFKTRVHSVSSAFVIAAALCYIPVYFYSGRFKDLYIDDDEIIPESEDAVAKKECTTSI